MSEFDWTYDIEAEVIYVGSKFRVDMGTVINSIDAVRENWSNDEFIEFEISYIGVNMGDDGKLLCNDVGESEEVLMVVINDCDMPKHSLYEPGYTQGVRISRVRELVSSGYWRHL